LTFGKHLEVLFQFSRETKEIYRDEEDGQGYINLKMFYIPFILFIPVNFFLTYRKPLASNLIAS